jgi:hypothetical protein
VGEFKARYGLNKDIFNCPMISYNARVLVPLPLDLAILTIASAANWAALGICYNSGQDCTAGSRVYVQDSIYDKFIELLVTKVKATVIGDGFDERSTGGPVVRHQTILILELNRVSFTRFPKASMTGYGVTLKPASKKVQSRF